MSSENSENTVTNEVVEHTPETMALLQKMYDTQRAFLAAQAEYFKSINATALYQLVNVGERAGVTSSAAVAAPVIKSTKRAVPPERVVHWKEERHQLQEKSAHAATQKIFDKLVKLARKQAKQEAAQAMHDDDSEEVQQPKKKKKSDSSSKKSPSKSKTPKKSPSKKEGESPYPQTGQKSSKKSKKTRKTAF